MGAPQPFDEDKAREAQRDLVDRCFYGFMAMPAEQRDELARRIDGVFGPMANGWQLRRKG
jgi:hypothetical protein